MVATMAAAVILAFGAASHAASDAELMANARGTVSKFEKTDPGLTAFFNHSAGYVVFPKVIKGGLGIGGAHGDGVVYQNNKPIGRASLTQVTVGAQIGGQAYSEVIFFETPTALANFVGGNFEFSGQVSAVALKSGASANAKYTNGVAVFTAAENGLMLEASLGGQKFGYEPFATSQLPAR
jgi:lipid-binding SYLF domain-containing protein